MNMPLAMSTDMSAAFQAGSGVSPASLRTVILAVCVGMALVICTWVAVKLIQGLGDGELTSSEVLRGIVSTILLAITLVYVIS